MYRNTRQRKAWHPLAGGQSWPWSMTPWPKINRVPPLIMVNVHVKFESDWAKTEVGIVSTRSYTQSAKVDLDLWPRDPKSIGFLLSSWWMCMWSLKVIGQKLKSLSCPQGLIHRVPKLTLTFDPVTQNQLGSSSHHQQLTCEVWKWLGKNGSLYRVHKVLYTKCQSWPWPLTPGPKINRVPPLIMVNVHVKFESDWAKNCSRYCVHKVLYTECQSWPWPLTPWPKINRVPPLIMVNVHVKFESDWAKTVVAIVSTR